MFGRVKLTENADGEKYSYSRYGIGFNSCSLCSYLGINLGENVIIFGVDDSSSLHTVNKKKDILLFGKGHPINFSKSNRKFCLSLYYSGGQFFFFVNGTKMYQFKAKDFKIKN